MCVYNYIYRLWFTWYYLRHLKIIYKYEQRLFYKQIWYVLEFESFEKQFSSNNFNFVKRFILYNMFFVGKQILETLILNIVKSHVNFFGGDLITSITFLYFKYSLIFFSHFNRLLVCHVCVFSWLLFNSKMK